MDDIQLNYKVSKDVMGIPVSFGPMTPPCGYVKDRDVPPYSTDMNAAFKIRDKMKKELFSVRKSFTDKLASLISEELKLDRKIHASEVVMRVTPRHICEAALHAQVAAPRNLHRG